MLTWLQKKIWGSFQGELGGHCLKLWIPCIYWWFMSWSRSLNGLKENLACFLASFVWVLKSKKLLFYLLRVSGVSSCCIKISNLKSLQTTKQDNKNDHACMFTELLFSLYSDTQVCTVLALWYCYSPSLISTLWSTQSLIIIISFYS